MPSERGEPEIAYDGVTITGFSIRGAGKTISMDDSGVHTIDIIGVDFKGMVNEEPGTESPMVEVQQLVAFPPQLLREFIKRVRKHLEPSDGPTPPAP